MSGVTATGSDDDSGTVVLTGLDDGSAFTLSVSSQLRFHTFTLEGATSRLPLMLMKSKTLASMLTHWQLIPQLSWLASKVVRLFLMF